MSNVLILVLKASVQSRTFSSRFIKTSGQTVALSFLENKDLRSIFIFIIIGMFYAYIINNQKTKLAQ
jgi:hypothetical protein